MSRFLWEIGTEEIPAGKLAAAIQALQINMEKALSDHGLSQDGLSVETQGTPRRLTVAIDGLLAKQVDTVEERRGPPVDRAFDAEGNPTKAALGFAGGLGVSVADLGRLQTPKGDYLVYNIRQTGLAAKEILPQVMNEILSNFPWPKSQRWGDGEMRFVRPINWILAILDGQVLPFSTIDGLAAGNLTQGHRFLARGPFRVSDYDSYQKALKKGKVVLCSDDRKKQIRKGVKSLAKKAGGSAIVSEALLMENVGLTEWPVPLMGNFDPCYLSIPSEVLITSMQYHQKYFPIQDQNGTLLPHFIAISNIDTEDNSVLIAGYERVLKARLEDAAFYWESDQNIALESRLENLESVVFQAKLGTLYEKSLRIESLTRQIALVIPEIPLNDTLNAARLCKCDLVTGMVGEFPELQGIMGGYYALAFGASKQTATAIREHYRPQGAADDLPKSLAGVAVSLADKLDTLVGCFGLGLVPSGAKDPFALRRAALGVIRMVLDGQGLKLPLKPLLAAAYNAYKPGLLEESMEDTVDKILAFFYGRLKSFLKSEGFDYDLIDAVQSLGLDDLCDVVLRVKSLSAFKAQPEYTALVAANKRIANILSKSGRTMESGVDWRAEIQAPLLMEKSEIDLNQRVSDCVDRVEGHVAKQSYDEALTALAGLRDNIDRFFDQVMVMDKDLAIRENRLALLAMVRGTFGLVADVSRLVLPE
ncbi:MAG: glycine--tRNA ligase subunit beta [Magnetococcales bacterium]|nr:glycine--tRNA ligase subunit beta [Magnetococcales bacterium]